MAEGHPEEHRANVLIVDDDPDLAALAAAHVRGWGHAAHAVPSADALRELLDRQAPPDVILLDVLLGDSDGSQLVGELRARLPEVPVIMITRSASIDAAVRSMRHGAADYITKPLDFPRLRRAVTEALEIRRLAVPSEPGTHAAEVDGRGGMHGILGRSPAMQNLFERLDNVAPADVSVLILGETGTGKELVARAIHRASRRCEGPFVAVNCAAIPHELIESALFGHRAGAFTGALEDQAGYCEQADGGTLFLDEIAEMAYGVQAKLLRFLQDHRVQRVGAAEARQVDVRVVAATNVDPVREIEERRLREDLYYRLRVVSLELPPLRERAGDVELLAEHFLRRAASRHDRSFHGLAPDARARLREAVWPGNVRELENVVEEAVVLHRGEVLEASMLPMLATSLPSLAISSPSPSSRLPSPTSSSPSPWVEGRATPNSRAPAWSIEELEELERVREALTDAGGDPVAAARVLGMSRATIYRRMKKYGIRKGSRLQASGRGTTSGPAA